MESSSSGACRFDDSIRAMRGLTFVVLLSGTAASAQQIALVGGAVVDSTGSDRVEAARS